MWGQQTGFNLISQTGSRPCWSCIMTAIQTLKQRENMPSRCELALVTKFCQENCAARGVDYTHHITEDQDKKRPGGRSE